jgi:hypothetical protein
MNPKTEKSKIALTIFETHLPPWYVSDLPGCDNSKRSASTPNSDWGYTTKRENALPLSPYWQRRFASDSRKCKRIAYFYEVRA